MSSDRSSNSFLAQIFAAEKKLVNLKIDQMLNSRCIIHQITQSREFLTLIHLPLTVDTKNCLPLCIVFCQ